AEPLLRIGAVISQGWVGNSVWRIKRRPVWNSRAARPPGRSLKASWGAGALAHNRFEYSGRVASRKPPPEQESGLGKDAARARNRPFLQAARRAGSRKGRKNAGIAPIRRFRRCTGRLKTTQPG